MTEENKTKAPDLEKLEALLGNELIHKVLSKAIDAACHLLTSAPSACGINGHEGTLVSLELIANVVARASIGCARAGHAEEVMQNIFEKSKIFVQEMLAEEKAEEKDPEPEQNAA